VRRGLKEAQSEDAGRRTGTGSEVWHIRDEWARDHEVLHPHRGKRDGHKKISNMRTRKCERVAGYIFMPVPHPLQQTAIPLRFIAVC